jgi:hypothetical protein
VTWSDLDPATADAVIAGQVSRFAQLARPWEWKHYSYDRPPDLPERLLAAGMTREPAEARLRAKTTVAAVAMRPRRLPMLGECVIHPFRAQSCRTSRLLNSALMKAAISRPMPRINIPEWLKPAVEPPPD